MTAGRVIKGIQFKTFRDAGDPVELAEFYSREGADELVFLDVTATTENRKILIDVVRRTAEKVSIPFSVGGGIRTIDDIRALLLAGADKVSINTGGFLKPNLIKESAEKFGSQCVILGVDVKKIKKNRWNVFIRGGTEDTGVEVRNWVKKAASLGAGEILLTSIDRDGTKQGYDVELTQVVSQVINVPIIASGGAGNLKDILDVLTIGKADAALLASLLHFGETTIGEIKKHLADQGVSVRLCL
jgi:cyclase